MKTIRKLSPEELAARVARNEARHRATAAAAADAAASLHDAVRRFSDSTTRVEAWTARPIPTRRAR